MPRLGKNEVYVYHIIDSRNPNVPLEGRENPLTNIKAARAAFAQWRDTLMRGYSVTGGRISNVCYAYKRETSQAKRSDPRQAEFFICLVRTKEPVLRERVSDFQWATDTQATFLDDESV